MRTIRLLLLNTAALAGLGAWLCFAQSPDTHTAAKTARTKPCDGCKPPPWPVIVTLSCGHDKKAQPSVQDLTAERPGLTYTSVIWVGQGNLGFSVRFEGKSPCQRHNFNAKSPPCKVEGNPGKYRYQIKLAGCRNSGAGSITVK